jgi:hypothetical protein
MDLRDVQEPTENQYITSTSAPTALSIATCATPSCVSSHPFQILI